MIHLSKAALLHQRHRCLLSNQMTSDDCLSHWVGIRYLKAGSHHIAQSGSMLFTHQHKPTLLFASVCTLFNFSWRNLFLTEHSNQMLVPQRLSQTKIVHLVQAVVDARRTVWSCLTAANFLDVSVLLYQCHQFTVHIVDCDHWNDNSDFWWYNDNQPISSSKLFITMYYIF